MKVSALTPKPTDREMFSAASAKFIPAAPGCYVCTDGYENILYIGRSETSIRARFDSHLQREDMKGVIFFHWLKAEDTNIKMDRLEQKWIDLHKISEGGDKPKLNKIDASLGC